MLRSLTAQAKALRWLLAAVLIPPALLLLVASVQTVAPLWMLMRDPVSIAELPPYTGFLSNLGVLLWCSAGTISLFAAALIRHAHPNPAGARFLFWGGVLTLMLMADDFFTIHEVLAFHGGLPDTLIIGVYAALAGAYFLSFRHYIWTTDFLLLAVALGFLGTSIIVDAFDPKDSVLIFALVGDRYHLVEDGPKLMGIAAWLGYFVRVGWSEILAGRNKAFPTQVEHEPEEHVRPTMNTRTSAYFGHPARLK